MAAPATMLEGAPALALPSAHAVLRLHARQTRRIDLLCREGQRAQGVGFLPIPAQEAPPQHRAEARASEHHRVGHSMRGRAYRLRTGAPFDRGPLCGRGESDQPDAGRRGNFRAKAERAHLDRLQGVARCLPPLEARSAAGRVGWPGSWPRKGADVAKEPRRSGPCPFTRPALGCGYSGTSRSRVGVPTLRRSDLLEIAPREVLQGMQQEWRPGRAGS